MLSHRGLLRLPPFPLARLEMAFTEEPPPHFKAPQEHSTPDVAASGAEAGGAAKQNLEKLQGMLTGSHRSLYSSRWPL